MEEVTASQDDNGGGASSWDSLLVKRAVVNIDEPSATLHVLFRCAAGVVQTAPYFLAFELLS